MTTSASGGLAKAPSRGRVCSLPGVAEFKKLIPEGHTTWHGHTKSYRTWHLLHACNTHFGFRETRAQERWNRLDTDTPWPPLFCTVLFCTVLGNIECVQYVLDVHACLRVSVCVHRLAALVPV